MNKILLPALFLSLAAVAAAQDQQVGARTKAMGGSYTAFEDDPVSIWLNPAGIATQPDGGSIAYQTYTIYEFETPSNGMGLLGSSGEAALNTPAIIPSFLGVVFQIGSEGNQAVGFSFQTPFRMKFFWQSVQSSNIPLIVDQAFDRMRVAYARDFRFSSEGFLTHLSLGIGLDVSVTKWRYDEIKDLGGGAGASTLSIEANDAGFGGGLGLLAGLYDNTRNFKVNFGAAWQSKINYKFTLPQELTPLFNWPNQYQAGLTFYFLDGMPLRLTVDAQFIAWRDAGTPSSVPGRDEFRNTVSYSLGAEYRLKVGDSTSFYPRAGLRIFNAPWSDKDDLPAVGNAVLDIQTKDDQFLIGTFGFGLSWLTEAKKARSFDLAVDLGGDAPGFAAGFTMEF